MNLNKIQFELLTLIERDGSKKISQRKIADTTGFSLGTVNKSLAVLTEAGYLHTGSTKETLITPEGLAALEPYRVKRAVILAAGFGSRLVPITLNTPKPLVRVNGKIIVETLLDAIVAAGITEIILVRGYLGEQFDLLKRKYPTISFVENPVYNETNNISSAWYVRDKLENVYICEADLLVRNPNLIRKYEFCSNYLGHYTEYTDDWCFKTSRNIIRELTIGGTNCHHMYGISYWTAADGAKLAGDIDKVFNMPGGKEKYWDNVALSVCSNNYEIEVRSCESSDIVEIDTFNELKKLDPIYNL